MVVADTVKLAIVPVDAVRLVIVPDAEVREAIDVVAKDDVLVVVSAVTVVVAKADVPVAYRLVVDRLEVEALAKLD